MMTRTQRLLALIQIIRAHRYPVTATYLAERLHISIRTVYRDIHSLQQQGVELEGGAGIGYILKSDYHLPPLMFTQQEVEALMLGLNWVSLHTDDTLKLAASNALSKVKAVLPEELSQTIHYQSLIIAPSNEPCHQRFLPDIRRAIHHRNKIELVYENQHNRRSARIVWPIALGFFDSVRLLAGWCELRQSFRHFRLDRIIALSIKQECYPHSRQYLLKKWKDSEGIPFSKTY